jgi:hypothetical protein
MKTLAVSVRILNRDENYFFLKAKTTNKIR